MAYWGAMRDRSRSPSDVNVIAAEILEAAIGHPSKKPIKKKNPAAVALGRLGGKKGGPARAKKLTATQRSKIARKAARARYAKK